MIAEQQQYPKLSSGRKSTAPDIAVQFADIGDGGAGLFFIFRRERVGLNFISHRAGNR
ncbi:hypothetical protein [Pantoea sp. CCBC3-3-1]|uniref:hypothetical protein n=1 Tax=Pantoea sp. CCBC3-3-1 TaxID=2490851 RepID=UPI00143D14E0|nr:hypothetical protein [Pantoea sp. CCBC3-3-1]